MTFKEIQELMRMFSKSGIGEMNIEQENFKIKFRSNESCQKIVTSSVSQPMMTMSQAPSLVSSSSNNTSDETVVTPVVKVDAVSATQITIKAPMIGTFYRSSGPDKEPFVKVGDRIEVGQPICIIEAMKLFNEIESEVSGTIVKVLINDASPIEYDQPLFIIEP